MLTANRIEILFMMLFARVRALRKQQLQKLADLAAEKAKQVAPVVLK